MRILIASHIVGCLLLTAVPAWAQANADNTQSITRSSLLDSERDKKAAENTPPKRSKVEQALYWYDNQYVLAKIFGGWKGIHLAGGDFPAGAGTKIGVGFTHDLDDLRSTADPARANRFTVDAVAARSTSGYARERLQLSVRNIGGMPIDLHVRGQHYNFPQEDFFGLGKESRKADRTSYLLESTETGAELQWRAIRMVDITGGLFYLNPTVHSGTDRRFPSTEQLFDPASVPGLAQQADFTRSDASIAFDWRDNPRHPHAGGRYSVQFSDFREQDLNAYDFRRVALDVQQYVPIPNRYRIIALHAAVVMTDPYTGQDVPFFYQPTLGGSQALRGFREFRFRDRNSLSLTAEYRWEAWWAMDGALFVDAGKVAAERKDLNFRDLDVSYGVGFRVHSNSAFTARLDLAFSREGFIPLLRFEHVF